jgi:hypothetical protein
MSSENPLKITILWGKVPEPGDAAQTYEFGTGAELDAFLLGIEEMDGWEGWREVEEGFVQPESEEDEE